MSMFQRLFPESHITLLIGGNIMHANVFGKPGLSKTLVHELGHTFGLWHVHHGISEMACDDPCLETHPSMVLGKCNWSFIFSDFKTLLYKSHMINTIVMLLMRQHLKTL